MTKNNPNRFEYIPMTDETFDPMRSIFLPKTDHTTREFSSWELAILQRRGELFPDVTNDTETYAYQCELYSEFVRVRDWYMGNVAVQTAQSHDKSR